MKKLASAITLAFLATPATAQTFGQPVDIFQQQREAINSGRYGRTPAQDQMENYGRNNPLVPQPGIRPRPGQVYQPMTPGVLPGQVYIKPRRY